MDLKKAEAGKRLQDIIRKKNEQIENKYASRKRRREKNKANAKERQTAVNVIVGVQERIPLSKRNNSCNATRIAADRCQKRKLT